MSTMMISSGKTYVENISLIDSSWIPVVDQKGGVTAVGLREIFERAGELVDLATGTLETIALYRLLLCITQRALNGPKNVEEWKTAPKRLTEQVLLYLEQWKDRFYLLGERPFLQIANLTSDKKNNEDFNKTDKLDLGLAVGNSSVVFDQNAVEEGRKHNAQWLAIKLLTFQNFSSSGIVGGIARVGDYSTQTGSCLAAPCAESSMLLTFLKGSVLSETICWNLLIPSNFKVSWGKPVWEYDDFCEKKNQDEIGRSYLGRLAPLARFVKLFPNGKDMIVSRGIDYSAFTTSSSKKSSKTSPRKQTTGGYREPMATIRYAANDGEEGKNEKKKRTKEKKELWEYIKTEPERSPWRDLHSLLSGDKGWFDQLNAQGAVALGNLKLINKGAALSLWVGGIKFDPMKPAKVIDSVHWNSQIDKKIWNIDTLRRYKNGVNTANVAEKRLRNAIYAYCRSLLNGSGKSNNIFSGIWMQAIKMFWSNLEPYQIALRKCAEKGRLDIWDKRVINILFKTYEQSCSKSTARQIQAFVEGKKILKVFAKKHMYKESSSIKEKMQIKERPLANNSESEKVLEEAESTRESVSSQLIKNVQQKTLFDFME